MRRSPPVIQQSGPLSLCWRTASTIHGCLTPMGGGGLIIQVFQGIDDIVLDHRLFPPISFTALNGTKDKKKKRIFANLQEMLAKFERDKKVFEKWTPSALAPNTITTPKTVSSTPTAPTLPPPPPREAEPAPDPLLSTMVSESDLVQAANALDSLTEKELENLDGPPEKGSSGPAVEATKEEFKKPPSIPDGLPPAIEKRIKELAKVQAGPATLRAIWLPAPWLLDWRLCSTLRVKISRNELQDFIYSLLLQFL